MIISTLGCGSSDSPSPPSSTPLILTTSPLTDNSAFSLSPSPTTITLSADPSINFTVEPAQASWEKVGCTEEYSDLIQRYNDYALDFYNYNNMLAKENNKNILISPYSVLNTIAAISLGANGQTHNEFKKSDWHALPCLITERNEPSLISKNAFWGHENYIFLPTYLDLLSEYFHSDYFELDYTATGNPYMDSIQEWIKNEAKNIITHGAPYSDAERIRGIAGNIMLIEESIVSEPEITTGLFERSDGQQYWVTFNKWQAEVNYFEDDTVSVTELPLGTGRLSLFVFMPKKGNFAEFSANLNNNFDTIVESMELELREITLPEFDIFDYIPLNDYMKEKGIALAFEEKYADFSAINGQGFLYLDLINNQGRVIFKNGKLSVAASSMSVMNATRDEPSTVWTGDLGSISHSGSACIHEYTAAGLPDFLPFIFAVRDNTYNKILTIGRMVIPDGEKAGSWDCSYLVTDLIVTD